MKKIGVVLFLFLAEVADGQELFVYAEPASNMAAKSVGLRLNHYWMKDNVANRFNFHLLPEIMCGV